MTDDKIKPTQADRDRCVEGMPAQIDEGLRDEILTGAWDDKPLVQSYVRHRIAATDTQVSKHSELADRLEKLIRDSHTHSAYDYGLGKIVRSNEVAILSALRQAPDAQVSSLVSAGRNAADMLQRYVEYLQTIPSKDLELHPYIPLVEDTLDELRAALDGIVSKSDA